MSVKDHYDNHLGNFYSWMTGDFDKNKTDFKTFIEKHSNFLSIPCKVVDLGAGHGIQSVAMAELGCQVLAVDFNQQLLSELESRAKDLTIEIKNGDIRNSGLYENFKAQIVICYGDTLPHLDTFKEIETFVKSVHNILPVQGKFIISFRDYSHELKDTSRFIPVKSDENKIHTCILEYFNDYVRVTDLLYFKENEKWLSHISSYNKVRITETDMIDLVKKTGFNIDVHVKETGFIKIIASKE